MDHPFPILNDLAHVAGCDPMIYSSTRSLGWIHAMQVLHNLFITAGGELDDLSVDRYIVI